MVHHISSSPVFIHIRRNRSRRPARLRRLARRARPRSSRSRVAFSDADLASAADADAAAALASHAPADAAAPAAGLERESCDTTQGDTDVDVASQLSRLSVAGAEAEPRSPRSPRTPKDACVVCWERRREVACYPCMCVAASRRFPLILHLTPRLRGDTPSPRSSQCLIRAGTSASARRAPARRTPVPCAGGPSRTCSACSCLDFFIIIVVVGVPRLLSIYEASSKHL
ncbi:unnamed protein product, partial [Pelagomonas calceolata]